MNLVFVYGPPAVGKHTVGSELARLTGYRLFHNHLTIPAVNAIFEEESHPERGRLLKDLRLTSIAAAAKVGINLIFTASYSGDPDDQVFIQNIADIVEGTPGGQMMYVQLTAPQDVLLARVGNESRVLLNAQKITNPQAYLKRLARRDIWVSVVYDGILTLDTTKTSPPHMARMIVEHFQL